MHEKASRGRASGLENLEQKRSHRALFESAKVSISGAIRAKRLHIPDRSFGLNFQQFLSHVLMLVGEFILVDKILIWFRFQALSRSLEKGRVNGKLEVICWVV